ncbi:PhnD/SsuA/transferrin family substrate-binding protein [Pigmentibacter sp. JX0631]|uniref:phosphate/phosphite/phosphonate ABC transporter substrate-binding protein n=1 Tax=Pigmentibacter sp. JX0631 TaxID=2976982 RepID=UPI00246969B9|nr:PhnD/SsuA/transferrin family substrate-binding protein [Pigmentibacter sp. JX0631]WGL59269.1 PhnD/SsuA/transferrin family substrate-binding protein [Pigmentibacter sp. JX0631]
MHINYLKVKFSLFLFIILTCTSCIKLWLGTPEIGSKSYPIEFYLDNSYYLKENDSIDKFQKCLEEKTGYHLKFNFVPDEKAVLSSLQRGTAHFGLSSALGYVGAAEKSSLKSVLLLTKKGSATNRSIIVGNSKFWKNQLIKSNQLKRSFNLSNDIIIKINNELTIAYSDTESVIGFLLPRMFLFQKDIFPYAAIFVGSYNSVLDALNDNLANIGVISESFLEKKYPNLSQIQVGVQFGDFIIIAMTPNLPSSTIIENQNVPLQTSIAIISGFDQCTHKNPTEFKKIFEADGVLKSNEKLFTVTKELYQFQQENIRILTQQEN